MFWMIYSPGSNSRHWSPINNDFWEEEASLCPCRVVLDWPHQSVHLLVPSNAYLEVAFVWDLSWHFPWKWGAILFCKAISRGFTIQHSLTQSRSTDSCIALLKKRNKGISCFSSKLLVSRMVKLDAFLPRTSTRPLVWKVKNMQPVGYN